MIISFTCRPINRHSNVDIMRFWITISHLCLQLDFMSILAVLFELLWSSAIQFALWIDKYVVRGVIGCIDCMTDSGISVVAIVRFVGYRAGRVLWPEGVLNDIPVSLAVLQVGNWSTREDIILFVVVAHVVELCLVLGIDVCLSHSFEVLLDVHDILLARVVALDHDSDCDNKENGCDDDGDNNDHFRSWIVCDHCGSYGHGHDLCASFQSILIMFDYRFVLIAIWGAWAWCWRGPAVISILALVDQITVPVVNKIVP